MATELIQASLNKAKNKVIYTFKFTFQARPSFWVELLGIQNWKIIRKRSEVTKYVTSANVYYLQTWSIWDSRVTPADAEAIEGQVATIVSFCEDVFTAVTNPGGKVSVELVKKANELLGPNMNSVLKVYNPGELHNPPEPPGTKYIATNDISGWQPA